MAPERGAFPMGRFERIYEDPSNGCLPELPILTSTSVTFGQIAPYGFCVFRLKDGTARRRFPRRLPE